MIPTNNFQEIIKNLKEYINGLENLITEVWQKLITARTSEGMKDINVIFENIEELINNIDYLNKNNVTNIDIVKIFGIFTELEKAMKIPDYIYIADILEYEVKREIVSWKKQLNKIK